MRDRNLKQASLDLVTRFCYCPCCLKTAYFKSGQNWPENNLIDLQLREKSGNTEISDGFK